jgi:hypothetical protein
MSIYTERKRENTEILVPLKTKFDA